MSSSSNPGQGTPPDSPSSSSVREVEDPSIYFRVQRGFAYESHVIKGGNSETPEEDKLLGPFLPKPPTHLWDSGCGVIGSTIYFIGGEADDGSLHDDVYYIDTSRPSGGWKKGCPTKKSRHNPYPVAVDGKLYVLGINAEAFDERKSCWTALRDAATLFPITNSFPIVSGGHALSDKNNNEANKILFHCKIFSSLYCYDIESDSWGTFSESTLGVGKEASAMVDGILYCLDYRKPGFMFGLDVSDPENELQMVLGLDSKNSREKKPLPQPGPPESSSGPRGFLVSMGNSTLAVLWAGVIPRRPGEPRPRPEEEAKLLVSCSKLEMSKRLNAATGRVDFVAQTLFPSERSATKGVVSKDGSTTSTNGGSSNESEEEKKKRRNRNRNKNRIKNKKQQQQLELGEAGVV
ncbi:hypothetical protein RHMOL_Rhmol01G0075900 [Rhododendron molle]|uniref:Uncharacterized protein n=1 Tax=Rhododendron molle TaxID=49168 RepID=A0ACC0PZK0_RHOML|nr:hypothetical protein RHMOL_Rhmol01G0075900 [Rhododendron molle]